MSSPREAVLIVGHGDGWVEVYGEKHIDARIEILPWTTSIEGQRCAEKYIEARLPKRYREIYWPGLCRAADLVRVIQPDDIANTEFNVRLLNSIKLAGEILRDESTTEGKQIWIA